MRITLDKFPVSSQKIIKRRSNIGGLVSFSSEFLVTWLLTLLRESYDSIDNTITAIREITKILSLKNEEKEESYNVYIVNMLNEDNVKALTRGDFTVFAVLNKITLYLTPANLLVWHKFFFEPWQTYDAQPCQGSNSKSEDLHSSEFYSSDLDTENSMFAPRSYPPILPASTAQASTPSNYVVN